MKKESTPITGSLDAKAQERANLIFQWKCLISKGDTGRAALIKKMVEKDNPVVSSTEISNLVVTEDVDKKETNDKPSKKKRGRPKKKK